MKRSLAFRLRGRIEWLWRRFTPAGRVVFGIGLVLLLLAVDMERSIAYQAFAVILALALVGLAFAPGFKGSFAVERFLPPYATVGQAVRYRARIGNTGQTLQEGLRLFDRIEPPSENRDKFARPRNEGVLGRFLPRARAMEIGSLFAKEADIPTLPPGGEAEVDLEVIPRVRGRLTFSVLTVARSDPLGLFRGWIQMTLPQSLTVLPRRYRIPEINLPGEQRLNPGGVHFASTLGGLEEFIALRDYRPGDSPRHIHWRSWAREGRPIVKEFADEYFARHGLILDTFLSLDRSEVFEEAVSVAASFAASLSTQETLLDLMFVGPKAYCFTAGRGLAHTEQMLEILAGVVPTPDVQFTVLGELVKDRASLLSGIIAVFVAWDESRQELVRSLLGMGVPMRILVITEESRARNVNRTAVPEVEGVIHVMIAGKIEKGLESWKP